MKSGQFAWVKTGTIAIVSTFAATACTHAPTERSVSETAVNAAEHGQRAVAQASARLPDHAQWAYLEDFSANLDLVQSGTTLSMSTGGTSVYAVINRGGRPIGAILPENAATKLSGEVMAFNLSRALGVADLYQPGVYHKLSGANLNAFRAIIPSAPFKGKHKEENRLNVLARIAKNPGGIDAIYKEWGSKPSDYDALVSVQANTMDTSHVLKESSRPFASFLKCGGPVPSKSVMVTMNKGSVSEFEAARQLSSIFLIDALTQQWDRFSGGNLQTVTKDGVVKFVAFDNGGTWGGPRWTNKYLALVTRFERSVAQNIIEMDGFLDGRIGNFQGLRTEDEFVQAMGIDRLPGAMPKFKASLKLVADHIRQNERCYFE